MDLNRYSVIVPTYNRLSLLKDALDSLARQTVKPSEVIVVDDGSSDGTSEYCTALSHSSFDNPALSYHRIANSGVSTARNLGAARATSDRLAFLDSDDVWLPRMGETLLKALESRPQVDWAFSNFIQTGQDLQPLPGVNGFKRGFPAFVSTDVDPIRFFQDHLRRDDFESGDLRNEGYYGDFFPLLFLGNFVQPSGIMIRRSAFFGAGGFDPSIRCGEETEFFHRLSARHHGMVLLPQSYLWRMGSRDSLSSSNTIALIEEAIRSHGRARALRDLDRLGEEMSRRGFALLYNTYLMSLLTRGQNGRARRFIAGSAIRDGYFTKKTPLYILASLIPSKIVLVARRLKRSLRIAR